MATFAEKPVVTDLYQSILQFVAKGHRHQVRRDGSPYLTHLLAVSAHIMRLGGTQLEAAAGLAHDYPEDICGEDPEEGLRLILSGYGPELEAIVRECTELNKQAPWRKRKDAYIEQIKSGSYSAQLVSLCDKYDNLECDWKDAQRGVGTPEQGLSEEKRAKNFRTWWFYASLLQIFLNPESALRQKTPAPEVLEFALKRYLDMLEDLHSDWGVPIDLTPKLVELEYQVLKSFSRSSKLPY